LAPPILAAEFGATNKSGVERLDRTNLLIFHDAKDEVVVVKSKADWQKRRAEILIGMQKVMGPLPGKENAARST